MKPVPKRRTSAAFVFSKKETCRQPSSAAPLVRGPRRGTKILIRGSKPVRVLRDDTEALETKMVGATQKRIELGLRILPFYVGTEIWKPLANKIRNASRQILFIGGDLARKGA